MEHDRSFASLLIVVFLAFVVPLALSRFRRLRLPIVVGEILAGVLVGRSGLGWVSEHDAVLDLLAEFGLVFLMFLAGMEIDFSNLGGPPAGGLTRKRREVGPVALGSLSFALTLAVSTVIGLGLMRLGLVRNPWMMALILSTTSLGVVMPVLKEEGLCSGQFGQAVLIAALIADFATMLLITVVVAILSRGVTLEILLISVLFVVFFLIYHFGMFFLNRIKAVRVTIEELSHAPAKIKVRASFTMMLVFIVLSQVLGTEVILGAFLAGLIISLLRTPQDAELSHQLEAVGFGFFIPVFFVVVGVRFNLAALFASPQAMVLVPLLLAAAIVVKFVPAMIFRLKYSWRETLAAGSLLSARLSLIIAASAIGLQLGVISESVNTAIILIAIVTVTLSPMVFVRLIPCRESGTRRSIIVVGVSELGLHVAEQLRAHNEMVILLDSDKACVARARQHGFESVAAFVDSYDSRAAPYFDQAKTLICTSADVELCYRVCQLARTAYGVEHIVAQVNDVSDLPRFRQLGVTTMNVALDRAAWLVMLARNPTAYTLLTRTDDNKDVCEAAIGDGPYVGRRLRELVLPGDVLVLALRRNGELLVPHGDTQFDYGDSLTLIGSIEHIETARQMFEARRLW